MSSLYPFSNNAAKVLQIFDYAKTFPKEFMIIFEKCICINQATQFGRTD